MEEFVVHLNELKGEQSTSAFAREAGIQQQNMDRYLKGREPTLSAILKICRGLNVSADWLLGLSETKKPSGEGADMWKEVALSSKRKLDKVNEALGKVIEGTTALQEAVK